jgi:hypothetical protein
MGRRVDGVGAAAMGCADDHRIWNEEQQRSFSTIG